MSCIYLDAHRAGEPLDYEAGRVVNWAEWTEYDCSNSAALNEEGCPFLDDFDVECPIKENHLKNLEDWAVRRLAGDRKDRFARVRELRKWVEDYGGISEAQLRQLFAKVMYEIRDDHYYDAMREIYWFTGWEVVGFGDVQRISREDGAFAMWRDKPFIEMSEEEFRELMSFEESDDDKVSEEEFLEG